MGFSKKTKAAVLAGAMTLGAVSGAYAYFSGTAETKSNVFNIVAGQSDQKDTAGTILEPGWNPANAVDLEPGQEVTKDPSLKSNVEYQSWAFLQVEIPAVHMAKKDAGLWKGRVDEIKDPYGWGSSTVVGILKKREYLGHTVNFKTRKHFKDKKSHYVGEDQ